MTDTALGAPPDAVAGGVRRVYAAHLIGATVDGFALTTAVLYFTGPIGLAPGTVGLVLALGAASALVLAPLLGAVADRFGLGRAAIAYTVLSAAALVGYSLATDVLTYAAAALAFLVGQAGIASVRQALVAVRVDPGERVRARAVMHTLLNAGMGVGAVLGAVALWRGSQAPLAAGYAGGAVLLLATALLFARLPAAPNGAPSEPQRLLRALRDRPFMAVTGLATLLQLTMPVLSVLLPVWVAQRTSAPAWVSAAALGLNTAMVLAWQRRLAAGARSAAGAARVALAASALLAAASLVISAAAAAGLGPALASGLVLLGVVVLTLGELAAGAASWRAALTDIPAGAEGQYQAAFGMASSGARILGPALALPLVLTTGLLGWAALAAIMGGAGLGLALMLRRHR